jgi:hydroxymethylpyrimidine/phosphomethylpyrimidine kinase
VDVLDLSRLDGLVGLTNLRKALTIAGSDSGGGAGIQADLKTFAAHGVYGSSAVTAITAQNTRGVYAVADVPEEIVAAQIDAVLEDIGADAAKTGMLSSAAIVAVVADRLEAWGVTGLVVDPVMVAKSGDRLLQEDAVDAIRRLLLPLALVATPNLAEAEVLAGRTIASDTDARAAAAEIASLGPRFVVVKGGHRDGPPIDLVFDGQDYVELTGERIQTRNTHGTGCTFAAAIAANLARGLDPIPAIAAAKRYLTDALRTSYPVGDGHSPVNHFPTGRIPDGSATDSTTLGALSVAAES